MADEFQTGVCSGNWWNTTRSGFDVSAVSSSVSPVTCSAAINEIEGFGWTGEMGESKAKSCEESVGSGSGSSITFQDTQKVVVPVSDSIVSSGFLMDSTLPLPGFGLSSQSADWSQPLFRSNGRAHDQSSFHPMLPEDLSSRSYFRQETAMESNQVHPGVEDPSANPYKDMNQAFLLDQHQLNSDNESGDCALLNGFPVVSGSYACHPTLLQGLFEQDLKAQHSSFDNRSLDYPSPTTYRLNSTELSQPSWSKVPQFLKASPSKQQSNQLHFSNSTPFWNASAAAVDEVRSGIYTMPQTQIIRQKFDEKSNCSNIPVKSNSGGVRDPNTAAKKSGNDPAFKKPRIETPSPLPTFKVRKEKLGDRVTALQQLVSPFGKTDTASVLHEAIDYIKFLHDQVGVLSTPYLKNGHPMQHQQNSDKSKEQEGPKQDLRSRGLSLVPISSIFPVTNEPTADFWTPTFGGTFR